MSALARGRRNVERGSSTIWHALRSDKPEFGDQLVGGSPLGSRAHHFPLAISFNAAFSTSESASSRFSVAFSASSSFNRLASSTFMPP